MYGCMILLLISIAACGDQSASLFDQDPVATPSSITLPGTVQISQSISSTEDREDITISYALDSSHTVFFQKADGSLAKNLEFKETIFKSAPRIVHTITLAQNPAPGNREFPAMVKIMETVQRPVTGIDRSSIVIGLLH